MSDIKYEFVCDHDLCVCDDALKGMYRIAPHAGEDQQDFRGVIQIMLRDGGLVPVEPCEHGKYGPHDYKQPHSCSSPGCRTTEYCDGAITDE